MKLFTLGIVCAALLLASMVDARGGGRGGGGRGGGSRGSSSSGSSSRGSSSSSSSSRTSSSTSSSSYGWRSPSSTSSRSSTSYGWRNPSTTTSSTYGWRNPSSSTTGTGSSNWWRTPSTSGSLHTPTTIGGGSSAGANRFLYGGGGGGSSSSRNTALGLGALAGASRFRTRTRYRGGGFSFESNSIEDTAVPARTVVLASSQSGTCNSAVTQRNATRPSTTVNVTIYEHDNFGGKKEVVQLPPRQCVNIHMIDDSWNDKASSIDPGDACVMIWEHRDCTGKFACFLKGTRGTDSLRLIGLNDELTSLQLC